MENTNKKKIGRPVKVGIAAVLALILAGASAYAINDTAKISEAEARQIPEVQLEPEATAQPEPADIGLEKAKGIALAQVSGATSDNIVKAYSDYDDGRLEYDIEIHYNGYEYDFEIDGSTGNILSKDTDRFDYD